MGLYRLMLAMLVAISHTGVKFHGFNPGVVAVISFFLLSGYVMTQLIRKHYPQPAHAPRFYLDRAARLFPQYLFYFLLTSLFIYSGGMHTIFTHQLTPLKWLLNIPLLPLGFYMFGLDGALVIPQAWSLGLEMCFYLCIPWLLQCPTRWRHVLAAASLLIFLAAFSGRIDTDLFGYRLLPGTLFIFLAGVAHAENGRAARMYRGLTLVLALGLLALALHDETWGRLTYNKEVLLGLSLGLLALAWLKLRPFSAIDEFLGNLSYGVFLNHMLIIGWLQQYRGAQTFTATDVMLLLTVCMAAALLSFLLIERPALNWRRTLRLSVHAASNND